MCKETLGPLVAVANPLDYHTFIWNNEPAMTATFGAMVSGGFGLNMLVLDFPRTDRCSDADWWSTVNAFESGAEGQCGKGRDRRLDGREPAGGARGRAAARAASCRSTASPRRWMRRRRRRLSARLWQATRSRPPSCRLGAPPLDTSPRRSDGGEGRDANVDEAVGQGLAGERRPFRARLAAAPPTPDEAVAAAARSASRSR